jgi:hypothetical protein
VLVEAGADAATEPLVPEIRRSANAALIVRALLHVVRPDREDGVVELRDIGRRGFAGLRHLIRRIPGAIGTNDQASFHGSNPGVA